MLKRYIYIIGIVMAAAMLLPGCMKLQTTRTDTNISFKPLIGHDTRAVESVPFPQERSFKVWAQLLIRFHLKKISRSLS
jgi:hypothetical protein